MQSLSESSLNDYVMSTNDDNSESRCNKNLDCEQKTNNEPFVNTSDVDNVVKIGSLYIEVEMDNATKTLEKETIRYYSTIMKTERVYVTKNVELEEQPTHVCRF